MNLSMNHRLVNIMSIYRPYTEMLISEEFFYCYVSDDNPRESARGTVQVVKDF